MRALAFILLLACAPFAQAAPTFAEKFDQYVALGWSPDEIVAGLERWFGLNFELATYSGGTYVQQVSRNTDRAIYRLEIIGKVSQ